jgi:DNA polymerase III subunit delta'
VRELRTRGQAAAAAAVERAIDTEQPPHALLLVGPPGVGKTTLGLDLAAGLLCLADDPTTRPCRQCSACHKVEHGNHPDLHRLRPEGAGQQIRLGQVQALIAELALLPLEGRFRVALIEQAQRLNPDAQNALLKTLEEPGRRVCLILAADESANLLPTLVSRCARLRLGPLSTELIVELLVGADVADAPRAATLARLSGHRPGVALILAGQPDVVLVHARVTRSLLDLIAAPPRTRLAAVAALLEDGTTLAAAGADGEADGEPAAGQRGAPAQRRAAINQLLAIWRDVARDLALAAHGGRSELRQPELLAELEKAAVAVEPRQVTAFVSRLDASVAALEAYANPDLLLDTLLLAWPRTRSAGTSASAAA